MSLLTDFIERALDHVVPQRVEYPVCPTCQQRSATFTAITERDQDAFRSITLDCGHRFGDGWLLGFRFDPVSLVLVYELIPEPFMASARTITPRADDDEGWGASVTRWSRQGNMEITLTRMNPLLIAEEIDSIRRETTEFRHRRLAEATPPALEDWTAPDWESRIMGDDAYRDPGTGVDLTRSEHAQRYHRR